VAIAIPPALREARASPALCLAAMALAAGQPADRHEANRLDWSRRSGWARRSDQAAQTTESQRTPLRKRTAHGPFHMTVYVLIADELGNFSDVPAPRLLTHYRLSYHAFDPNSGAIFSTFRA
jgi:hypothetical protein